MNILNPTSMREQRIFADPRTKVTKFMNKIALIDGYGFIFRAYHALPPLSRADGTPVGAVLGFVNMLVKILASLQVTHLAIVFDSGGKNFRHEIYPEYKANRPPCPEDLKPQFPIIREASEALNLFMIEQVGAEADDIIATLAKRFAPEQEVLIISSDKDLMQLIGDNVLMYDAMKNKIIGSSQVLEKFGVLPDKVLDILSLIGDVSDNIPGIKGIGPKTAAELINQFDNLDNIFNNLDSIKQEKRRIMLQEGFENAKLSKQLASLKYDLNLNIELEDLKIRQLDPYQLCSFLSKQNFKSLLGRFIKEFKLDPAQIENDFTQINQSNAEKIELKTLEISSPEILITLENSAMEDGLIAINFSPKLEWIALCAPKISDARQVSEVFYFNFKTLRKLANDQNLLTDSESVELAKSILQQFYQIMQNPCIKKLCFNLKPLMHFCKIESYDDLALTTHLASSMSRPEFIDSLRFFGINFDSALLISDKEISALSLEQQIQHLCNKNSMMIDLFRRSELKIFEYKLSNSHLTYELPLIQILSDMEMTGICVDPARLTELSKEFVEKIKLLEQEIYKLAGKEFNILSPKQLGEVLFEDLKISSTKKSKKSGNLSTSVEILENLEEEGYEIAGKVLEFRKFSKLKSTYADALLQQINPETKRIHTTFSNVTTSTGRLSSSDPNVQNIPIRTTEGRKIRSCFVARPNHQFICADYSQVELRMIAHMASIGALADAFKTNKDIHSITASEIFGVSEELVSSEMRSKAKAINFGIIYGISPFGLARQLGISRAEAGDYIAKYLATYPGIDLYMKNSIDFACKNGFVETIAGRKCFIRNINDKNFVVRSEAQRLAINAPIQGSAADLIKMAMIGVTSMIESNKLRSKLVLQIHDELVIESPEEEIELILPLIKREMENALIISVPLKVDVKVKERL